MRKVQKVEKLTLSRETLRDLEKAELQGVAGGVTIVCTERCTGVSCYC